MGLGAALPNHIPACRSEFNLVVQEGGQISQSLNYDSFFVISM